MSRRRSQPAPAPDDPVAARLSSASRRLAELERQAAALLHDVRNPATALNLALRAVGRHLQGDERAALDELVARLAQLEQHAARLHASLRDGHEDDPEGPR